MTTLLQSYWAATDELPLLDTTCGGVLRQAAAAWPTRTALIDADGPPGCRPQWSYAALAAEAEAVARALVARLAPGSHVALWAGNSPQWVIAQLGIALAGMVLVTVNPALGRAELAYVLGQSRARALFHGGCWRGVDMQAQGEVASRDAGVALDFAAPLASLDDFVAGVDAGIDVPQVAPRDAAMIQYTSGTTGKPKGALLNHFSITNNARMMAWLKALDEHTVNLAVAPLFHTAGCVANVLGALQTGGALLLPSAFDADSMLDLIEQERVTYTFGVPTMLIALLDAQAARPRDLSSLQTVFSGAATVPVDVVRRVEASFGARLIIGYGQTETSPAITHTRLDDNAEDKSATIGRALPQVEIKVVDPVSGATLPVDTPGELLTRGFLVMMGYFDMPEATAATIDPDGWLRTGDLCSMDARGYCRITGRLKDLIIRGGENIYPREIEEVLHAHPAVGEVAVIGVPDDYWGETVVAVITRAPGAQPSGESLRAHVTAHLARHKVPQHWFALDAIPSTASGKVQKFHLVEMARTGELERWRI